MGGQGMGSLKKWGRWEFWPPWAAYAPLAPYWLSLAARHGSFTVFTAANPGIPSGGLAGESKSRILAHLSRAAAFILLKSDADLEKNIAAVETFSAYPVVLKPDVGERGTNVAVIRSAEQLRSYLASATGAVIAQRYVAGLEFGIFYVRYPHEAHGSITSITEKRFPHVTGDGRSTLAELIGRDSRASLLIDTYRKSCARPMNDVPARGEHVRLVEIGSHCRGAIFANAGHLHTDALAAAIDASAREHPGFYFGRFDVRSPSIEDLQSGGLTILELNGVAAEATHIYDPSVSIWQAYGAMFRHWRWAFEIGALNRSRGADPMSLRALWKLCLEHRPQHRDFCAMHSQHDGRACEDHNGQREELSAIADSR
jgi:hypothetical protein